MKYENLKIEVISLDTSDVIATSKEVTTGAITMPWQTNSGASEESFNLMSVSEATSYDI